MRGSNNVPTTAIVNEVHKGDGCEAYHLASPPVSQERRQFWTCPTKSMESRGKTVQAKPAQLDGEHQAEDTIQPGCGHSILTLVCVSAQVTPALKARVRG